jgi:hypothetical protein
MSRKIHKPGREHLSNALVVGARTGQDLLRGLDWVKKSPSVKDGLGNFLLIGLRLA